MTPPAAKIVLNEVSRLGLRTVHVVGYNEPVRVDEWLDLVPGEARNLLEIVRSEEKEIGVYHLYLHWNAREMVEFRDIPVRHAALWYIAKGERMRDAIDLAASLYRLEVGIYPRVAWTNTVPKGAPEMVEIEVLAEDRIEVPTPSLREVAGSPRCTQKTRSSATRRSTSMIEIPLREAWWMPERYVCVGIETREVEVGFENGRYVVKG